MRKMLTDNGGQGESVRYEEGDGVGRIWLARPERRNALDIGVWRELCEMFEAANASESVRVVVLGSEGPVFCAGQNLKFTVSASEKEKSEYEGVNLRARELVRKLRKPVVARVQGHALGGGLYLALSCDLVVAAKPATFALREILAGEESGGALLWSVGRARSMEASLLGRSIGAEEAERWGLINRVVEVEELDEAVEGYVQALLKLPPMGLEFTKASQNALLDKAGYAAQLEESRLHNRFLFQTADAHEARLAFIEKREAKFVGR